MRLVPHPPYRAEPPNTPVTAFGVLTTIANAPACDQRVIQCPMLFSHDNYLSLARALTRAVKVNKVNAGEAVHLKLAVFHLKRLVAAHDRGTQVWGVNRSTEACGRRPAAMPRGWARFRPPQSAECPGSGRFSSRAARGKILSKPSERSACRKVSPSGVWSWSYSSENTAQVVWHEMTTTMPSLMPDSFTMPRTPSVIST